MPISLWSVVVSQRASPVFFGWCSASGSTNSAAAAMDGCARRGFARKARWEGAPVGGWTARHGRTLPGLGPTLGKGRPRPLLDRTAGRKEAFFLILPSRRPSMRGKALLAVATLLSLAGTAAARFGMPEPLTDRGRTVEDIYAKVTIAGILVFVLVFALLVFVLVRYREGSGKGRATHEKHRGSLAAEMTWTLIPLAVVLWVGAIAYAGLVHLDRGEESEAPQMTLHVTGVQWAWQVDYGSGVKVNVVTQADAKGNLSYSDTIHVPAGVPLELNLTGGDVIHAFNILDGNRAFFFMEDANPLGPHKYHAQVLTSPAGKDEIQCKEMCLTPGHGYMRAQLVSEPQASFDRWFEERKLAAGHDLVARV